MSEFKDWIMDEQEKQEQLNEIEREISEMTINDFSNMVDYYDLGVNEIDDVFWKLRDKLYEIRSEKNESEQ
tara:strand:- start:159 stop:371 length:213 start_codon:yes stop_codon:yes gene_type:complete